MSVEIAKIVTLSSHGAAQLSGDALEIATLNETHLAQDASFAPPPPTGSAMPGKPPSGTTAPADMKSLALACLDDMKAVEIVEIDLVGKTALADTMLIASGNSQRHVGSIADRIVEQLKEKGFGSAKVEGMPACDWVLIDAGDIIVHVFRPEVRSFYNLEKMWGADRPAEKAAV